MSHRESKNWVQTDFRENRAMASGERNSMITLLTLLLLLGMAMLDRVASQNYGDALSKCILFFEGQRSGKLPPNQRMNWRKDSALRDGFDIGVSL